MDKRRFNSAAVFRNQHRKKYITKDIFMHFSVLINSALLSLRPVYITPLECITREMKQVCFCAFNKRIHRAKTAFPKTFMIF